MDVVLRVTVAYFFVLIALRLMGKREFGELSPLELITLLLIPELLSDAMQIGDQSIVRALAGVSTVLLLVFVSGMAAHLSPKVENAMEGTPSVLVAHGELILDNMNRERMTPSEIFSEMHKAGLDDLPQVRWAVLETDGKISIVPEPPAGTQSEEMLSKGPAGG